MASSKTPRTYAEALEGVDQAKAVARRARLNDPEEHFATFDKERALAGLREGPEPGTNNHPEHWYTSEQIIEAQAALIDAERAYLQDPSDETKDAFREAQASLGKARAQHRRGRPVAPVAVAGAVEEIEQRRTAMRSLHAAGFDAQAIAGITQRPLAEVQGALNGREDH